MSIEQDFRVIHCGIESERYVHRPAAGVPGRDRPVELLCVAAHRPTKGLTHLIEAVRLLRRQGADVRCDVIGDGELRPKLQRQIDEADLALALEAFDPIWDVLLTPEKERVLKLLIEKITYDGTTQQLDIDFRMAGIAELAAEVGE